MKEIFKPIVGKEKYLISNFGRIKTPRDKIMKLRKDKIGYMNVNIYRHQNLVHRLVAYTFIPNPENKPQVNHINGDKADNRVENLEWVTRSENLKHFIKNNGAGHLPVGSKHKMSKLTEEQVLEMRRLRKEGASVRNLKEQFNISESMTYYIIGNYKWKHI